MSGDKIPQSLRDRTRLLMENAKKDAEKHTESDTDRMNIADQRISSPTVLAQLGRSGTPVIQSGRNTPTTHSH